MGFIVTSITPTVKDDAISNNRKFSLNLFSSCSNNRTVISCKYFELRIDSTIVYDYQIPTDGNVLEGIYKELYYIETSIFNIEV